MPLKAKVFISTVIGVGASVLLACMATDHSFPELGRFLQCLALALVAGTFKVQLPGMRSAIAPNFVVFLIAVTQLVLDEVVIIAALSCAAQCLWRPRIRPKPVQIIFSVAATITAITLTYQLTASVTKHGAVIPAIVFGSAVFFMVNSGLVSTVVALVSGQQTLTVWRNCHRWAFPYYLLGSVLAAVITASTRLYGWSPSLAMLPLMCMVHACYQQWMDAREQRATIG